MQTKYFLVKASMDVETEATEFLPMYPKYNAIAGTSAIAVPKKISIQVPKVSPLNIEVPHDLLMPAYATPGILV